MQLCILTIVMFLSFVSISRVIDCQDR